MLDQVPVDGAVWIADGAVVVAVGVPHNVNLAPPAPADAADGNNARNINDNALPAAPPVAREVSVFLVPISFSSRVIRAGRYLASFSFLGLLCCFSFYTVILFASLL